MSTDATPLSHRPFSPRQERFVAEYLRTGNATRAYVRAGYSARGAQPSASRLLRDPRIEAAIAASRQRLDQALDVDVRRVTQEYAKIAYANIDDFVSTDAEGCLRVDLDKASLAQQAGIVELRISNHRKPEQQQVILKLGKLQALAALQKSFGAPAKQPAPSPTDGLGEDLRNARLRHQADERAQRAAASSDAAPCDVPHQPAPGLTAQDRQRYEERCAGYQRLLDHREAEQRRLEQALRETQAALDAARAECGDADPAEPSAEEPFEDSFAEPSEAPAAEPETPRPPIVFEGLGEPDPAAQPQRAVEPGMPTGPLPDHTPGLYPEAKFVWSGGRELRLGPDSADALRAAKPGGFPGR
jgi:phage terminase small subunit